LYSRLFSLNIRAASEFAGEFGFGSQSKDCNKKINLALVLREKAHTNQKALVMPKYRESL